MLLDLLNEDTIKIYKSANDWEEAGRIAGQLLVDKDKIEEKFIDAMIESVKKFGPYIVLAKGVALFHARPDDGVKSMSMSLVIFKDGVFFNVEKKDPIKLVLVLAPSDSNSHLEALAELSKLLEDQDSIKKIIASNNYSEIVEIIKRKLH